MLRECLIEASKLDIHQFAFDGKVSMPPRATRMNDFEFNTVFEKLTGNPPLSWQQRLFRDHFAKNDFTRCGVIDLPTGLGKTMVMAIWLIARAVNPALPRRLIYVVDRRTIVDQATDLAITLQTRVGSALPGGSDLAISTLRGQLADNREWSRDLSKPAIVIGTVDLIGSALLFSGYRSSLKRRPLEAGLLAQDSLLLLDEAHLSSSFATLLTSITAFQSGQGVPMQVIHMSATSDRPGDANVFKLQLGDDGNLAGEDANDATVAERFGAPKTLSVVESDKTAETIAAEAAKLAAEKPGSRIVIFVRSPKQVNNVRTSLEKKKGYVNRIAQLTGTMRGLERDELVDTIKPLEDDDFERRAMQRFLKPENDPSQGECFLISTSAGEVGFDLNGDHLIGDDEAPLNSWIQRLGRVNRRGNGKATVKLIKKKQPAEKTHFDKACIATSTLLTDGMDVSPKALLQFRKSCKPELIKEALSPEPTAAELTDILLDAWSMTSITAPMPGRPEVGPWLRGIAEWEPPQTTIAWRAELDLDGFADLDPDDIEEWYGTHRILAHETLCVNTADAAAWFQMRWAALTDSQRGELATRFVIVDRAGFGRIALGEVLSRLSRKAANSDAFLRGAEIIVPASFGGIRRGIGLLDPTEPKLDTYDERQSPEEQAMSLKTRQNSIDVADVAGQRGRYRKTVEKFEDSEPVPNALAPKRSPVEGAKYARYVLELISDDDRTFRLFSYVSRWEKLESGSKTQTLMDHVKAVCSAVDGILSRLTFAEGIGPAIKLAAEFAVDYHDHGKNRALFQRTVGGTPTDTVEQWQAQTQLEGEGVRQCLGKSGGQDRGRPVRGYRHEFGSICEFGDAFEAQILRDSAGNPIDRDTFDLAMHLIATHHGRGRPHFPKGGFDPDCETRSDEIHTESIRRFARLQRKYGWWHLAWLENLLRCADSLASSEDDPADAEGVEQ
jgi:CRISPR-associated endonuclease/helicase Cas3